ncbi:sugar transferase [Candidatus Methylopumilus universalis]|uniref:Sugar transferase n=1 Tax=Candidatus Methylopumilus universalis TaxID=2588536 RepID=A0AAX1EZP8_9PROT|nr:sugar transferase [Candidatus Methylopumilus universalis]QDC41228.1 sugar transferase [Candidatus Methylopumilus universalis]QDC42518.1 sugar transferase [Candidatus Methylopumilus universalis]QDC54904.1 sugar transferase [Candidatus Methylopumilus universalis]QDC56185.1 sugar transferase [Candidatus Methylopumilus universalis]QDC57467.1 sugar transferase [Candidatus Methylopumilus universalis]
MKSGYKEFQKRIFDIFLLILIFPILMVPIVMISLFLLLFSENSILYWSDRVGKNNIIFKMPKFRTMKSDAPILATHLFENPEIYLTSTGRFLRKTSLDELPQLINIFKGEMSFVGPRPALFNQQDLISLRSMYKIHQLLPGLTGWAQVNGRDELSISDKVLFDLEYLKKRSLFFDIKILILTLIRVTQNKDVSH